MSFPPNRKATEVIKFLDFIASDYKTLKLGFENEIWRWEEGDRYGFCASRQAFVPWNLSVACRCAGPNAV